VVVPNWRVRLCTYKRIHKLIQHNVNVTGVETLAKKLLHICVEDFMLVHKLISMSVDIGNKLLQ